MKQHHARITIVMLAILSGIAIILIATGCETVEKRNPYQSSLITWDRTTAIAENCPKAEQGYETRGCAKWTEVRSGDELKELYDSGALGRTSICRTFHPDVNRLYSGAGETALHEFVKHCFNGVIHGETL